VAAGTAVALSASSVAASVLTAAASEAPGTGAGNTRTAQGAEETVVIREGGMAMNVMVVVAEAAPETSTLGRTGAPI